MTGWFPPHLVSWVPVASFIVTWIVLAVILRTFSNRILDHPNERSLHQQPVPRMGGVGVTAGIAVSVPFVSPAEWWPLWLGAALLVGVSFLDDLVGLPIVGRLVMHFVAAGGFVAGLLAGQNEVGWTAVAIVATVWMTNLYNFMDGMDGLAGGMAVFGFGFLAVVSWLAENTSLALMSLSIASAAGGFLFFNFPPARIFLGDAGSTACGFLAAGLGLIGWRDGTWSLWFPAVVFSPFIVDATVTLLRRALQGERFWLAHRTHYYQRLVLSGWGHRKTVLAEYGLMVLCGALAWTYQLADDSVRPFILGSWGLLMLSAMWAVHVAERLVGRLRTEN
jgi:UDP-N-acetylmuramyl pentapeptide phosphotransferase/UDP-N-acetylglucosamine-1-phosphate transferase